MLAMRGLLCGTMLLVLACGARASEVLLIRTQQVDLTTADGVKIRALEMAAGKDAMLIYCHRLLSSKESFDPDGFGDVFLREFDVLAFDFRGHRQSRWVSSCGGDEVLDLRAAIQYARKTGHRKIVLLGVGMGGVVAIREAALFGNADAVVAVSPCGQPEALKPWWWNLAADISLTTNYGKIPIRILSNTRILGRYWTGSPVYLVDRVSPAPLLLIHGQGDRYLNLEQVQALYDRAGEPKKLLVLPRSDHAEGLLDASTAEHIVAWLEEASPPVVPDSSSHSLSGPPVSIRDIDLRGDVVLPEKMIEDVIRGAADGASDLGEELTRIREAVEMLHEGRGYLLSRVSRIHLSPEGRLSLAIQVGRVDHLAIEGNRHVPSERIQQVLRLGEGHHYNAWEVETAVRRLSRFPVFDTVESQLRQDPNGNTVGILIRERRPWSLGLVTRWTDFDKFGGISFSLNEFRSSTWRGFARLLLGLYHRTPLYRVDIEKGWFRPEVLSIGLDFQQDVYNWYDWEYLFARHEVKERGGGVHIAYNITDQAVLRMTLSRKRLAFFDVDDALPGDSGLIDAMTLRWEQDGRFLRRGEPFFSWRSRTSLEATTTRMHGDCAYTLFQFNLYPQLAWSRTQTLHLGLHWGHSVGEVPPQKLFALGGDKTAIGYLDDAFLGEQLFLLKVRYDLKWGGWLNETSRLAPFGGSFLFDVGDAFMRNESLEFDALKFEAGVELNYASIVRLGVIKTLGKVKADPYFYVAWYPHFVRTRI